jgi:phosphatidylinositol-3-phosphatase
VTARARRSPRSRLPLVATGALAAVVAAALALTLSSGSAGAARQFKLPHVRHVFVIVLENEDYASTFGDPSADPYLAQTLPAEGALLENYYGTGHESNDNYISLVSGQPPNPQTQADCQVFDDFTLPSSEPDGVEGGTGCVYPAGVPTIGNQLSARQLSWKGYMEDMGNDPKREAAACGHPALNAPDGTQAAESGDGYATRHDPFVYFHAVIDNAGYCDRHIVALGSPSGAMPAAAVAGETGLVTDLKRAASAPALSFIVPNLCNDGHDYPCANRTSGASAAADIDAFLKTWVPLIRNSPAYGQGGLIEITFDEGADGDSSACCGEAPGPGAAQPGIGGPGGGRVGALLLSPYVKPGSTDARPYNHYSSLASWEQLFGLRRLAYAGTVRNVFGADVYNNYRPRS